MPGKKYFFRQYPVLTAAAISLLMLMTALFITEQIFSARGYVPGYFFPDELHQTDDTIFLDNSFYSNEYGWLVADREANTGEGEHYRYINSEGFPSYEFDTVVDDSIIKILLLGDSHAWGASAGPVKNCFASLLDARHDFIVFNTGIPATDPAQYNSIAGHLIPRVRPDVTMVVMSFNDVMWYERPVVPWQSGSWYTNVGYLDRYVPYEYSNRPYQLTFKSLQDAYDFGTWQRSLVKDTSLGLIGRFCRHFNVPTQLYYLVNKKRLDERLFHPEFRYPEKAVTEAYFQNIKTVAEANNSQFLMFVIPGPTELITTPDALRKRFPGNFDRIDFHVPGNLSLVHYASAPDEHLNTEGHILYGRLMEHLIDSLLLTGQITTNND